MASKKALVVDNDRLYVELLSDILEENGTGTEFRKFNNEL